MNKEYIDSFCGICAGLAAYTFSSIVLSKTKTFGGMFVRTGCVLIQTCFALEVGKKVKRTTGKITNKIYEELRNTI